MAKPASIERLAQVQNILYTQSGARDALVTLTFDDPNAAGSVSHYELRLSRGPAADWGGGSHDSIIYRPGGGSYQLNLYERGLEAYAVIIAHAPDGSSSPPSEPIKLVAGEADSDGCGIPDWYKTQHGLWGMPGENKDIANTDEVGDGFTNLEKYHMGASPWVPITFELAIAAGEGGTVTAGAAGQHMQGETIELAAEPDSGYEFAGWISTAGAFADAGAASTEFTMPRGGAEVTATFRREGGGHAPVTSIRIADAQGRPAAAMISVSRNSAAQFGVILNEGASSEGIAWSVSNANLATVSPDGLVTIRNMAGTVVLTARAPGGAVHSITLRIT